MKLLRDAIAEGAKPPLFYALSYFCYDSDKAIYHPWGINLIVRWGRRFYFWISKKLNSSKFEYQMVQWRAPLLKQYWKAGFEAGKLVRRDEVINEILKEFDSQRRTK